MSRKKKTRHHYHRRHSGGFKLKKQTVYTVGALWLWLFAIIITLSFFGEGTLLIQLKGLLYGKFGWTYYLLPPFIVTLSLLFFKLKSEIGKPNIPLGTALLIIALNGITQSGDLGVSLWSFVAKSISGEGAILVFIGIFVAGIIVVFNTSLETFVNAIILGLQHLFESFGKGSQENGKAKDKIISILPKGQIKIKGGSDDNKPLDKMSVMPVNIGSPKPKINTLNPATPSKSEFVINDSMTKERVDPSTWEYPPVSLLSDGPGHKADRGDVRKNAQTIEETLSSFGIQSKVVEVNQGPAVTQYALKIPLGTKVSKVTSLSSDLAMVLSAQTGQVRIEAPIPGRDLVGIELPNRGLEFVTLKKMLLSPQMQKSKSKLAVALGLDVSGNAVISDIGRMPHVLVAGTTGSGKSVLINSWICSLLFRTRPDEVRLILVDPKRVELTGYNNIPHLLTPVIVEPDKILSSLRWAMTEMEKRYKQFAQVGVRNIDGFNEMSGFQAMPYIIIFIDELADLMAYAPVEVEDAICRLAQMARATGIHLVLSTQRPSVDVITGLIKANVPTRIAFNVSSMIDSRVVLDMPGAEKLLGRGDMLYVPPEQSKPSRIQGTYVSEQEVGKVVEFICEKNVPVNYTEEVLKQSVSVGKKGAGGGSGANEGKDALFDDALKLICQHDKASASLLQRRLSVGYARAARMLDQLEEAGIIGPGEGAKPRDVLVKSPEEYYALQEQQQMQQDANSESNS
jgi:DNA segregation ATPase FtsK/SpoIIIE, S-DNA-T family